jgi:hypothetical protein
MESQSIESPPDENPFTSRLAAPPENGQLKKASLLASITTRKRRRPIFGILYGPPGIGKSTFVAQAPNPIFIQCERGLDQITIDRFPQPKTLADYKLQIQALVNEEHDYKTIVIDTLDGLELLIWDEVCRIGKCDSIEAYGGGWAKGYVKAREIWTKIMERLVDMSEKYNVLLVAHAHVKSFSDPTLSAPYDQWKIRLNDKSSEILFQMVDLVLFANVAKTIDKENARSRKGRAIIGEDREMWTQPSTGIEAKNRFALPNPMPFEWEALQTAVNAFYNK